MFFFYLMTWSMFFLSPSAGFPQWCKKKSPQLNAIDKKRWRMQVLRGSKISSDILSWSQVFHQKETLTLWCYSMKGEKVTGILKNDSTGLICEVNYGGIPFRWTSFRVHAHWLTRPSETLIRMEPSLTWPVMLVLLLPCQVKMSAVCSMFGCSV